LKTENEYTLTLVFRFYF